MTQAILPILIVLACGALPAAWGLRVWAATVVVVLWRYAVTPDTPLQNQGPFDGTVAVLFAGIFILVSLGVGARAFWALANGGSLHMKPPANSSLYRTDCLIAAFSGLVAGTVLTLLVASGLRGMAGGLNLHLAVSAIAAMAAIVAIRLPGRTRPMAATTLATLACLTLAGGTLYPGLILAKAQIIQPDAPRCLRTPEGIAPTTDQLRLLTLPRAQPRRPNLVLTIVTDRGPQDFRWSYRSFAFRTYDSYNGGACPAP
jgi:uncharacterized membrane protein (UPF0136 family)